MMFYFESVMVKNELQFKKKKMFYQVIASLSLKRFFSFNSQLLIYLFLHCREAGEHLLTALNQQAAGKGTFGERAPTRVMSDTIWSTLRLVVSLMHKYHLTDALENRYVYKNYSIEFTKGSLINNKIIYNYNYLHNLIFTAFFFQGFGKAKQGIRYGIDWIEQ